jgi:superoxide dismutase, Cu-Zn family
MKFFSLKARARAFLALTSLTLGFAFAQEQAMATLQDSSGAEIGTALFTETPEGLEVTVAVAGLPAGNRGMHIHGEGSCENSTDEQGKTVVFGSAGGHFDPHGTENHAGPDVSADKGHPGDFPNLEVSEDGTAQLTHLFSDLTVSEGMMSVVGLSLIIHENEDNYTNEPKNGGSGGRIACGVVGLPSATY